MKALTAAQGLPEAMDGSYYTIVGIGGSLDEWLSGYEELLLDNEIGKPQEWFTTTGAEVNLYAEHRRCGPIHPRDQFRSELLFLLFPLDGLHVGRLAVFRIKMQDRWFDDMIENMRIARG